MIPDAAVEAAYSRIADNLDDTETESWKGLLRDALEAAAPHMSPTPPTYSLEDVAAEFGIDLGELRKEEGAK